MGESETCRREFYSQFLGLRENLHLVLHRENYLDEPDAEAFRDQFSRLAGRLTDEQVGSFLQSRDWRDRIIGIYCVSAGRRKRFEQRLRDELRGDDYSPLRRPLCLALLVLEAPDLASDLSALLERPFDPEDTDATAAAVEALRLLDDPRYAAFEQQMPKDMVPVGWLKQSQQRFRDAIEFWSTRSCST